METTVTPGASAPRLYDRAKANLSIVAEARRHGLKLVPDGPRFKTCCPSPDHEDKDPSCVLYPDQNRFHCYGCGADGSVIDFAAHVEGRTPDEVARDYGGGAPGAPKPSGKRGPVVATFNYHDETGELVYRVQRHEPGAGGRSKDFIPSRPDGQGGWVYNLAGVTKKPYRLEKLAEGKGPVTIAEGEGLVDLLAKWGYTATTNSNGSGGSGQYVDWSQYFADRDVYLLVDNDEAGEKWAAAIVKALSSVAASIRRIDLPGLSPAGDLIDWHRAGGTPEQFAVLMEAAVPVDAPADGDEAEAAGGPQLVTSVPARAWPARKWNDVGNAERVAHAFGPDLLFCHELDRLYVYRAGVWRSDDRLALERMTEQALLKAAKFERVDASLEKEFLRFISRSLNRASVANCVHTLRRKANEVFKIEEFDANPDLLNVQNGTIDLRTGKLREHRREDRLTRMARHAYDPDAKCPQFEQFMRDILPPELIDYVQVALGYSITARTGEKAFFICHGDGNNGKSTLLSEVRRILGEYATSIHVDSLMRQRDGQTSSLTDKADLMDLRAARFAMTSEAGEGQRFSEALLKRITVGVDGLGRIKACRKYENPCEFPETHKLWLDCNHLPRLSAHDDAVWNRIRVLKFGVRIPDDRIDRALPDKLLKEAPGILTWLVRGAVRWYAEGLRQPEVVTDARDAYRADQDELRDFFAESCEFGPDLWELAQRPYDAYRRWAEAAGIRYELKRNDFDRELERRGCFRERKYDADRRVRVWKGVRVVDGA